MSHGLCAAHRCRPQRPPRPPTPELRGAGLAVTPPRAAQSSTQLGLVAQAVEDDDGPAHDARQEVGVGTADGLGDGVGVMFSWKLSTTGDSAQRTAPK